MDGVKVEVVGLRDLQKALRQVDADFPKELRKANKAAAEDIVSAAKVMAFGVGGVAGKASGSLRAVAEQRSASVKLGGARYPYALGAEFGALRYHQFKPWRGNQWSDGDGPGYFLHPSIRARREQILEEYGKAIDRLTGKAFPN